MNNKYAILGNVCLGTLLTTYVSSCINIALPNIMQALNFNLDSIVWVSLSYLIPFGSILPFAGKLGDQYSPRRIYISGLILFTLATLLCGLASNSTLLIMFRIFQGISAAMLSPNAMAIVATTFPASERSKALGLWSATSALGTASGPTIGGFIIDAFSWRSIFISIIPLALTGILVSFFIFPKSDKSKQADVDYAGMLLMLTGVSCLLLALNQGQKEGWDSIYIVSLFFCSGAAFLLFTQAELYVKHPMIDMGLFRNRNFVIANIIGFISILVMSAGVFLLPFFLKTVLGYDSIKAGLTILPLSIAMLIAAPVGGWMVSKFGTRVPATMGILMISTALLMFRTIDPAYSTSHFSTRLLLFGTGLGFTMSPLTSCVMDSVVREKIGVASGVLNLFRIIGGGVGVVMASTILNNRTAYHSQILSEYITPDYQAADKIATLIQYLWGRQGMAGNAVITAAHGIFTGTGLSAKNYHELLLILASFINHQAAVLSFQDVFGIMAALSTSSVLLILLIRSHDGQTAK